VLLKLENVQVFLGKIKILKDVSFSILEKETVFIIGPNGSGKTTCLNTICGIHRPASGRIEFMGEPIDDLAPHVIVRKGIGIIPQGRRLFADQTIMDNLRLGYISRSHEKQFDKNVEFVFGLFPILRDRMEQLAGTLSGGEQQMLAFARTMMAQPRLLLCDELSSGLAPKVVELVFETLVKLQALGTTILIVEQLADKVFDISSRGYIMTQGQIIYEGNTDTLRHDERVKKAYLY
jgi:branched-chain amino acid transport system ATP-binding protein